LTASTNSRSLDYQAVAHQIDINSGVARTTESCIVRKSQIVLPPMSCFGLALKWEEVVRLLLDCAEWNEKHTINV
jgi:hypothetical protein